MTDQQVKSELVNATVQLGASLALGDGNTAVTAINQAVAAAQQHIADHCTACRVLDHALVRLRDNVRAISDSRMSMSKKTAAVSGLFVVALDLMILAVNLHVAEDACLAAEAAVSCSPGDLPS